MKIRHRRLTVLAIVLAAAALYSHLVPPQQSVPQANREPSFRENFYDVAIEGDHAWIVGYYGTILTSRDGGSTWTLQQSATREALFRVSFIDAVEGWVAGSYGTLLRTSDGGATWQELQTPVDEHLFGLQFIDRRRGWAVGGGGTVIATEDGGHTWENRSIGEDVILNDVRFVDGKQGWLVGEFGRIYSTSDGGRTWVKQESPVEVSLVSGESRNLFRLLMPENGRGWAFGLDGMILSTENGVDWRVVTPDASPADPSRSRRYHLFSAAAASGAAWAVGERGTVLISSRQDAQWNPAGLKTPPVTLNGVAFEREVGIIVGNRGLILRTDDGGRDWQQVRTGRSRGRYGDRPPQ